MCTTETAGNFYCKQHFFSSICFDLSFVRYQIFLVHAPFKNIMLILRMFFRAVKMSSPMINNIILAGCFLLYAEVLMSAFDYVHALPVVYSDNLCMVSICTLKILKAIFTVFSGYDVMTLTSFISSGLN